MNLNIDWKLVLEALKEPARWFILSVVSFAVTLLLQQMPGISDFLFNYFGLNPALITGVLTYILRAIDKYLYKLQKEKGYIEEGTTRFVGLTGF